MSQLADLPRPSRAALVVIGALGVLIALAMSGRIYQAVLIFFAAILLAIFLDGLAGLLRRYTGIGQLAALTAVLLAIAALLAVLVLTAGPAIGEQITQLGERLPEAVARFRDTLEAHPWSRAFLRQAPEAADLAPSAGALIGEVSGLFSTTLGALVNLAIVVITGVYLAVNPGVYLRGFLALVPTRACRRAEEVLGALGEALRWWLVGRVATMTAVGVLTALGLWLVDMPLVLALGLTAGLLSFVPVIGPVVAAVPALLLALMDDPVKAAYVLAVYSGVQFLEGNLITPLIQNRTVSLPPAMLLVAQLLMGILFGFLGVLLATPLAVTVMVLIQMLYVQDVLGRPVRVVGQHGDDVGRLRRRDERSPCSGP